ncbi:MAG: YihY/virulence factor BrkB family protein [Tissierellia bacterium]|nr:YihY/virulence factor BrkB family protein [Tissierellia bacterium]
MKVLIDNFKKGDLVSSGAMLAYFLLFSLFPFLIFFLNLLALIAAGKQTTIIEAMKYLPENVNSMVKPVVISLINSSSGTLLSASFILAVWSGSNGIIKLMREINLAFGNNTRRGFFKERLLGIVFTLALAALLILLISSRVFGNVIINAVYSILGENEFIGVIWGYFRSLVPLLFMILVFTLLYKFSASNKDKRNLRFRDVLPGAIFTTITWIALTIAFAFYVDNFGNYDKTYGSLGGIIVLMTWLFLSSIIMIVGAYVASAYVDIKNRKNYKNTIYANIKKYQEEN